MQENSSAWLAPASLVAIIVLTLGPFFIVPRLVTASLDETAGWLLVGALAVVSVVELLLDRFVVLPQAVAQPESTQENVATIGYSFALAPAIFGNVASVFTGQALLALPFGAFALVSWAVVRQFLQDAYAEERRSRLRGRSD